jgi:dihydroflavonol-4-reductase
MARTPMYVRADKAVQELGLVQTPVDQALRDAVAWFVAHGYAPSPPAGRPTTSAAARR